MNAGLEGKWCAGQEIILDGAVAGTVASGQLPTWSLVSGPGPVTIEDSTKVKTKAVATVAGEYVFRLSIVCGMGKTSQDVKHIVSPGAQPDAGEDISVNCFDQDFTLHLDGNQPPPGFYSFWTVPNGSVIDNIYRPSFQDLGNCPSGPSVSVLQYNFKDNNGCLYSDSKVVSMQEYVPPLRLGSSGGCGKKFQLFATCTGAGQGEWTFISPADGGGASFESPTSRVTGILNADVNQVYIAKFTITGSCHDQSKSIEFTVPKDSEAPSQADFKDLNLIFEDLTKVKNKETISYTAHICGIPDTLMIRAAKDNLKNGEKIIWSPLSNAGCSPWYGEMESEGTAQFTDEYTAVLSNLGFGTYILSFKVVNAAGCETNANIYIVINQPYKNSVYFLSNECKSEDFNMNNYYRDATKAFEEFKIYDTTFVHFLLPYEYLPKTSKIRPILEDNFFQVLPISSPPGGENKYSKFNKVFNLTNHKFEYYFNMPKTSPPGQYIFQIPYEYTCDNYATLIVDYSQPPEKVNGGTDQYFCGSSGQLIGNDRAAPEWILLYKKPADIPDPILEGANTRLLTITNLTAQSEYYFGYVSRGGSHCPDVIDTVKIGVSDVPPPKPDAGEDRTVCAYSAVTLTCQPSEIPLGSYGYWEVVSQVPAGMPPSFKPSDKPITQLMNLQPNTTYTLRFTLENKCGKSSDEVVISTNDTEGPPPAFAGADRCLPPDSTQVFLTALRATGDFTGQWTQVNNNPPGASIAESNNPRTLVSNLSPGIYGFIWTLSGAGCASTHDTVWVTIGAKAAVDRNEILLCNQTIPTSVTLRATPADGGYWTNISLKPANITNPNSAITTVTGLQEGIYVFRWTAGQGVCSGFADVKVIVGGPTPIVDAGPDIVLCRNSDGTVTLDATLPDGLNGYWTMINVDNVTPSAGFTYISGNSFNPHIKIKVKPGQTRLRWTILEKGICADDPPFDDVLISYFSESIDECCPKVCTETFDANLCNNTPYLVNLDELVCTESDSGIWVLTLGPGLTDTVHLENTFDPLHRQPGTYTLTYRLIDTLEGCPVSSDVMINIVPQPDTATEVSASICPNETYTLPSGGTVFTAGIYADTLQTTYGCDSIVVTHLSVLEDEIYHKNFTITADPDSHLPAGKQAVLTVTNPEPGATYQWYKNDVLIGEFGESIEIEVANDTDVYSVKLVNPTEDFCSGEGSITIDGFLPSIKFPNAFSPNNDGTNDVFRAIADPGVEVIEMTIVNRWGQSVYTGTGNEGWDGRFRGKDSPADTYIFLIRYKVFSSDEVFSKRGELLLVR
ncbi:MAG TPA: gliding motility-associated C-terminal domain-containing protein [Saprospiraceae bacterium]|nr:gliding motility-associated C-terminal domain-containing protein [Saprospiraceae bacterium]